MIKYPSNIKKQDTIGVTATSAGITGDYEIRFNRAQHNLEALGYKIKETENVRKYAKLVSSSGKERANEFLDLWKNDNISLIAQVTGGEFLMEMIPYIDKSIILEHKPKWITGYSDSSLLNYYITTNFNIATATSPNFMNFGMINLHDSLLKHLEILENGKKFVQESYKLYEREKWPKDVIEFPSYNLSDEVLYKSLYGEKSLSFEGRLIGGCIDVIYHLLGTPFDNTKSFCEQFKEDGMLWYLENCELPLPSLYRVLWQMKQSGWFNNANGFIIGRTKSSECVQDFEYLDVLHKIFDDMNVPVIYDVDFGHQPPQWTMINGSFAKFEYNDGKGKIDQYLK